VKTLKIKIIVPPQVAKASFGTCGMAEKSDFFAKAWRSHFFIERWGKFVF